MLSQHKTQVAFRRRAFGLLAMTPLLACSIACTGQSSDARAADKVDPETIEWHGYQEEVDRLDRIYNIAYGRESPGYQYEVAAEISSLGPDKTHWFRRYYRERKLSPDGLSTKGVSLLRRVSGADNPEAVEYLLNQGGDPNLRDSTDHTPLFQAAVHGNVKIVEILIDHGANVDPICNGMTPLQIAAASGHIAVIERLLASGANPSNVDLDNLGDDIDREGVRELFENYAAVLD
ncbi:MAG: hypothetical protein DHS20C16_37690 [Phycisphaerae bacterium]|nr:MAG: hypothetical protein DHS20C16_37690 [Phycisphaerae bacterium]